MTVKEMREKRGQIAADMAKLDLSKADERTKFDAMDQEQNELKQQIDRNERAAAIEAETRATTRPPEDGIGQPADDKKVAEEKRTAAFRKYLKVGFGTEDAQRLGMTPLNAEERKIIESSMVREQRGAGDGIMSVSGGATLSFTGAGVLVPTGFLQKVEEALKYFGGMLEASTIWDTDSGQPIPYPTDNDTSNMGELVGEGIAVGTQEVTLSQITFGAYKFSTKLIRVSLEMLQDSAFDIESYLSGKFGTRWGRAFNYYFTLGNNSSQPNGIINASTSSGQTVIGDDNATTPDPTTQVGFLDLVNLEHSVDKAYRTGAKWMANDSTIKGLKKLKDAYGRPLWLPGLVANAPDTILGYGYIVNNDMAVSTYNSPATVRKSLLFGDLKKYMIRRVKALTILRLSERYAEYGQVGFVGFARADGNLLDAGTHPVKYLANPAS